MGEDPSLLVEIPYHFFFFFFLYDFISIPLEKHSDS